MTELIATLSAEGASNWEICKRERLWGTGARNNHSKHAVSRTAVGDSLYVWQSGTGVIARARVTGRPFEFTSSRPAPWPQPETYVYGIPIEVDEELAEPAGDAFDGYRSQRFGVQTHQLQSGYAVLKPDQAEALESTFSDPTPSPAALPADRPALAAVYLRSTSTVAEALLALYRQNRAAAEDGEFVIVGDESSRAEFEAELTKLPFDEISARIAFVTPAELEARIRAGDSR